MALAPPTDEVGSEIARPAARQFISIIQPLPAYSRPPMIHSSGMNTSVPEFGPFWNTALSGRWRRPMFTPGVAVGTSAQVMPRSSLSPSSFSGSYSRNARPSSVATGPSVM